MRSEDPRLTLHLDHDVAEVGGQFRCTIKRSPQDGVTNTKSLGLIRAVRVGLHRYTEGRGDEDSQMHSVVEVPVDEHGMASSEVVLAIPRHAPISYDGDLIRVRWEVEARTDRQLAIDHRVAVPVLVVPRHGLGRYERAHPLP